MVLALLIPTGACAGDPVPRIGTTRAAQTGTLPSQTLGDPEAQAFLAASAPSSDPSEDEGQITVQRSETGAVRMVFGTGFRVPLAGIGCAAADLAEGARCFLSYFRQAFRLTDPDAELVLLKVREDPHGERVVLFNQQHLGYPVFGRQVLVTISPSTEVTHVYSTLAVPLTSPDEGTIQSAFATADASQCLDAARTHVLDDNLRAGPTREVLWPELGTDSFAAIPALSLLTYSPGETEPSRLFVVDAGGTAVLESRSLVASLPDRVMEGYARHPAMSIYSSHPTCSVDGDCTYLGPGWACSNDFSPRRCFKSCATDDDCALYDYKCFLPASNPELGGYCHWEALIDEEEVGYPIWWSFGTWYNPALADHKAYRHIQESLDALVSHHYYDMDLTSSYDGEDGPYWVNIHSQCYGCQNPPPGQCDCACEYTGCGGAAGSVTFGTPRVSLRYWKNRWASTSPYFLATSEHIMGHEWGHVLVGSGYGWAGGGFPPGCVGESAADTYGALFGVTRLGGSYAVPGCGGYTNTPFWDDRAGLNPGCKLEWLKNYAYRSRFDLLDCGETTQWYATCSAHADCPAYQVCEWYDEQQTVKKCTNLPGSYNGSHVFFRLLRILAEGASAIYSDGHRETLGIPHSPLGMATTIDIINYANRHMSSTTTIKDWMNLILSGGSAYGRYTQVYLALGASGFFPNQSLLTSYTTDRDPLKIIYPAWYYASDKTFVIWKESGAYNLKVKYNDGGTPTVATIAANTGNRPTAVVHGNYLHIYYRDRTTGQIKVQLIHYNGWFYGPYNVDPGPGQLRPTGAFEAVHFQNRVYLVFADSLSSRYLSIARCDNSVYCASSWHDFGGGIYKKVVRSLAVLQGMSAVSASAVHGRLGYTDLYIAAGEYYGGRVFVTRVNSDDSTGPSFYIPTYYPSYTTITGLGIEARQSAFPYFVPPLWFTQNYLYLVWKDRNSSAIYTSVLQDAPSSGTYRFTKSQPTFYDAKADTGVSWAKGSAVTEYIQGVVASPTNSMIYQFNGYGRY